MIINPYLVQPSGPSYGTLTTAWIAATGESDLTILGALNTLETDLTTYGLTAKMKALYPMVGGTATKHKYNFMDARDLDAAYRLVFNGGWTHSSTGALPNGTNAYADTKLVPSSASSLNSSHISYYSRTNANNLEVDMGAAQTGNDQIYLEIRTSGSTYYAVNTPAASQIIYADSDSRAFYMANRTASNVVNGWRNSSKVATGTAVSNSLTLARIFVGAVSQNNSPQYYSTKQVALASIGDGLTDTESANFYTAVQRFQTTLGRQVGTPIPFALPLDTYTGAAAAYSTARRLSSTYTGSLIRVRRSSDNAEQNIGYDANNVLDESALTTFVGAGNGFVTTWYDQSGNGRNTSQTTAANQPQIVSSGSVIKELGQPAIKFDGSNDFLNGGDILDINSADWSFALVGKMTGSNQCFFAKSLAGSASNRYYVGTLSGSNLDFGFLNSTFGSIGSKSLYFGYVIASSNRSYAYKNGSYVSDANVTPLPGNSTFDFEFGAYNDGTGAASTLVPLNGNIQEAIFYNASNSTNRTGIESNINSFYSIY